MSNIYINDMNEIRAYTINELQEMREKLILNNKAKTPFGIAEINTIQNSTSYVSGEYSVAMVREMARIPLNVLGQAAERNLQFDYPSLPRIYDGAALYWMFMSSTTTPVNATFSGDLTTIWN